MWIRHALRGRGVNTRSALFVGLVGCCALLAAAARVDNASAACPNEGFRTGPSSELPDCRAYELVTPPDTAGRSFKTIEPELAGNMFPTEMVTASGESALFMSAKGRPLAQPAEPNSTADVYQALRLSSGWQVVERRITPSGSQAVLPNPGGVSSDHRYTFVEVGGPAGEYWGTLGEGGGEITYLGNPDGSFELAGVGSLGVDPHVRGRYITENGQHIIFVTGSGPWCSEANGCAAVQLEPNAPPAGTAAIYDRSADGPTHVVSLLPNDVPQASGEDASYQGVSADGTAVAFKVGESLLLRPSQRCGNQGSLLGLEHLRGHPADGSDLFYVTGGDIFDFSTGDGQTQQLTSTGDAEPANISADGSHVYFISRFAIAGRGEAGNRTSSSTTGSRENRNSSPP